LDKLRDIAESVQKRESLMTEQTENAVQTLSKLLFPHEAGLRDVFNQISGYVFILLLYENATQRQLSLDKKDTFRLLQPKNEASEYYEQVKYPMCWHTIEERLDAHEYWDPDAFKVYLSCFLIIHVLML
jgi:hypothetical protein